MKLNNGHAFANRRDDTSKKRGGRSKRLYKLTKNGLDVLIKTKTQEQSIWANDTISGLEKGYDTKN